MKIESAHAHVTIFRILPSTGLFQKENNLSKQCARWNGFGIPQE
jgi:hypothetical protein